MARTTADGQSENLRVAVLGYGKNQGDEALAKGQELCAQALGKKRKPLEIEYLGDNSWTMYF